MEIDASEAESENRTSRRKLGDQVRTALAYVGILTVGMVGVGVTTSFWSSTVANLQIDLRRSQEEGEKTRAELAQIKSEYQLYRERFESKGSASAPKPIGVPGTAREGPISSPIKKETKAPGAATGTSGAEHQETVVASVLGEKTASAFRGELFISLLETAYEPPARYKVTATVGATGYPNVNIENKNVGYVMTYKAKDTFEVRIIEADSFSAKFLVTQLPLQGREIEEAFRKRGY